MSLEITRQKMREQTLGRFKHVRTCVLARELCMLVRANRVALNKEDVQECCSLIAGLCREAECNEPSQLCTKAAEAVLESEENYLEFCAESCRKCSESRQPKNLKPERQTHYVA
ncbi:hypothetical protein GWN63_03250 [Candidatus Bathyarchaeota archaeon]|nr:hypothetical protein [Candidatus Bathyarchaeota archaeon]NIR17557.1 hypothetical protein [Desulfobacterales bacterium]NIU81246.1 hypothetical protein [Candidatus Bathyarchaeota archaeon]NIV67896.1 hypothetical protein [Candidatus Bathyarchaeota archaeon]NIW16340.1 hypothetical protein [Candidatus Bathyarchaeota archaeon]